MTYGDIRRDEKYKFHHMTFYAGYISRTNPSGHRSPHTGGGKPWWVDKLEGEPYKGTFGEGYTFDLPSWEEANHYEKHYYVLRECRPKKKVSDYQLKNRFTYGDILNDKKYKLCHSEMVEGYIAPKKPTPTPAMQRENRMPFWVYRQPVTPYSGEHGEGYTFDLPSWGEDATHERQYFILVADKDL